MWRVALLLTAVCRTAALGPEIFDESLLLRPLRDGHVLAHFSFRVLANLTSDNNSTTAATVAERQREEDELFAHYGLFPKPLGQILHRSGADELRVSMTRGEGGAWQAASGCPIAIKSL